jgi:hypothetical protein
MNCHVQFVQFVLSSMRAIAIAIALLLCFLQAINVLLPLRERDRLVSLFLDRGDVGGIFLHQSGD